MRLGKALHKSKYLAGRHSTYKKLDYRKIYQSLDKNIEALFCAKIPYSFSYRKEWGVMHISTMLS